MAIDPNLITTVQVGDLPPNPISLTDNIVHEVAGILSRATVEELVAFLQAQTTAYQYEIKILRPPGDGSEYINANFNMAIGSTQGLGKVDGLWPGWAICNGNNGTDNMDGVTFIGWGANYGIIGDTTGAETHTLTINEMPAHSHNIAKYNVDTTGSFLADASGTSTGTVATQSTGGGQSHNNMQPSGVFLIIKKL